MDKTNTELIEIIKGKNLDVKGLSKMNRAQLCKLAGYDDCGKRVSVTKSDSKASKGKTKEKEVPKKEPKEKEKETKGEEGKQNFSKLTIPKLKEYLKGEGIPFKSSDKKADLVKLAESSKGLPKENKEKEKEEKVKEEKGKEEPKGKEDFSKLTVPKLKEYLKGKGIAFKSSDKKADLVKLAEGKEESKGKEGSKVKEEKRKTPVKAKKIKGELTSNKIGIDLDEWISHMLPKSPEEVKVSKKSKVNKGKKEPKGKEETKGKEERIDSEELYEVISDPKNLSMIVERGYLKENPHYVRHVFKSGENLLLLALKQNNDDVVFALLNMDIDIFHRDSEGYDALDYYSFYYNYDAFFSEKLYELLIVQTDEVKRMLHYFKNNTFFKLSVEPWDSTIDLSGQKLKEIPEWFYQTPIDHTVELSLDLSNNQLTSLPSFNFMNIKYLNISHNKLNSIDSLVGEFNGDVLIAHHNHIEDYSKLKKIFYTDFSHNNPLKNKEKENKEDKEKEKIKIRPLIKKYKKLAKSTPYELPIPPTYHSNFKLPKASEILDVKDVAKFPHMVQNKLQGRKTVDSYPISDLCRSLTKNAPREKYQKIEPEKRSVNHWGQRKLMMSEIEFLTRYQAPGRLVVYAGAAPGTHIPFLAHLFPNLNFLLVDPAEFRLDFTGVDREEVSSRLEVRQSYFQESTSEEIVKRGVEVLFISDIRTADFKVMNSEEVEVAVAEDMKRQQDWAISIKAVASMHKFRLPWDKGITHYLGGTVYLPVWGPQTTTETRLIVEDHSPENMKDYDNRAYEEAMFYFNNITRSANYEHDYLDTPALYCPCYDCASEIVLLEQYFQKVVGFRGDKKELKSLVVQLALDLNLACSPHGKRNLQTKVTQSSRNDWFEARIYDTEKGKVHVVKPNKKVNKQSKVDEKPKVNKQPKGKRVSNKK